MATIWKGVRSWGGREWGRAAFAAALLALAGPAAPSARAADDDEVEADENDGGGGVVVTAGPEREASENRMPRFEVSKRMYEKPATFFSRAKGGKDFKSFYAQNLNTRGSAAPRKPEDVVGYSLDAGRPFAFVYRPPAYDEAEGKGWGVYVHLATDANEASFFRNLNDDWEAMLTRQKLVFLCPVLTEGRDNDDLRNMAVTLDLLASLREAYPPLNTSAAQKRTFVGGVFDGARLAGILALNFPNVFAGFVGYEGVPGMDNSDVRYRRGRILFIYSRVLDNDLSYWDMKDVRKLKGDVRVALLLASKSDYLIARHMATNGYKFNKEGFKTFFMDRVSDKWPPPANVFEESLKFLDGKKVNQDKLPVVENFGLRWRY